MMDSARRGTREAMIKRDRVLVLSGIGVIAALAWLFTIYSGMGMEMMMPVDLVLICSIWMVMMVAMMLPSVVPTLLMYTSILRSQGQQPFLPMAGFLIGYFLIWSVFAIAAGFTQFALHDGLATVSVLGGGVIAAAGIFQLTPLKRACLARCRSPLGFFTTEWREGNRGALAMGVKHGAFCLGCCWLLMGLLFVAGAMNLVWMAGIAIFVLVEKAAPFGEGIGRLTGVLLIGAGAWMALTGIA